MVLEHKELPFSWPPAPCLAKRLGEFGIDAGESRDFFIDRAVRDADVAIARATDLQRLGETLSLRLSQSSAAAAMDDLRRELETLRRDQLSRETIIRARNETGDLAQKVIEALREAVSGVVRERLQEIGPLLQSIWTRIDPHPAFRVVSFFSLLASVQG